MIEEDIASRCRETLNAHQIRADGLSVNGRDVLLSGSFGSRVTSDEARILLERVSGVRTVKTQTVTPDIGVTAGGVRQDDSGNPQVVGIQAQINEVLQEERIDFKPDSAVLTPQSRTVLNSIVKILSRAPNLRCEIRGNSESASNAQHEWMMTLQRALATEDYLASKGVADWRMSAQVFRAGADEKRQIDFVVKER
jgi:outer membrane protein OmpA-like peptidoglycan-associated protein